MIKYVQSDHNRSSVIRKVRNDGKLGIRSDILPYKYKTLLITEQYYSLRQLLEPAASILKQESSLQIGQVRYGPGYASGSSASLSPGELKILRFFTGLVFLSLVMLGQLFTSFFGKSPVI